MSKREIEFYIVDIFVAYDKVRRYSSKFSSAQALLHSELEWDATIRELEIIGEAANHLIKNSILDEEYRIVVDFRNQINHGYFGINEEIVWEVVHEYLPQFCDELHQIVKHSGIDLSNAIDCAKMDNSYSRKTVVFLDSLKGEK